MQLRGFNPQAFAQNHPGGALSNKMNMTVADIMHQGENVATMTANASMDEIIIALTQKKLGAVLVVEGKNLLGLITDGDLRRALKFRENFFKLKASDVMTRSPITVPPETKLIDALRLMENRPSQISILPVIDSNNSWKGLIRLHDIVHQPLILRRVKKYPIGLQISFGVSFVIFILFFEKIRFTPSIIWSWTCIQFALGIFLVRGRLLARKKILHCIHCNPVLR